MDSVAEWLRRLLERLDRPPRNVHDRPMTFSNRQSLTVLVVDDDNTARVQIAAILDAHGHRVIEAHNAEWALQLFDKHQPDVALLDVNMPVHDGFWLARRLRERESGKWTPIIFVSARATD